MKKIIIILFIILLWTLSTAQTGGDGTRKKEEKSKDRKNFFYLNPLPFISNTFQINYERLLSNKIGLLLNTGYTFVDSYDDGKRGGNGEIHLRFYLTDTENKSRRLFYFSTYARYQYIETTPGIYLWNQVNQEYYFIDIPNSYINSYSGGLLIGLKWLFKNRLTFDMCIGGGMQYSDVKGEQIPSNGYGDYVGNYTGTLPKLGLQFGYNF